MRAVAIIILISSVASGLRGESTQPETRQPETRQPETRNEAIQQQREQRIEFLQPEAPPRWEQRALWIRENSLLNRVIGDTDGWRIATGGMTPGQGFAIGPEYRRRGLWDGRLDFRTSWRASAKQAWIGDLNLSLPKLAGGKAFTELNFEHRNEPYVAYFGRGPKSREENRDGFGREDTSVEMRFGVRPLPHLKAGLIGGFNALNVGRDGDGRLVPPGTAGAGRQANFLRGGGFLQFDTRNYPGEPTRGGNYIAQYQVFSDRSLGAHDFTRLEVEAQQYVPFFNDKRVIALRAKTMLSDPRGGQSVPFYLQPTLGGSDTLRGFRDYRFYDDNAMVLTAEYRFEVFSGMDMALFTDAGKVFPRWKDLNFDKLEASAGFGLRFNVRNSVFMRVDTGFSREGYQVWLRFSNVF
ncbi:MAG: BamA/TamA family outer membrane protein [Bryobacteraceae bacterium]